MLIKTCAKCGKVIQYPQTYCTTCLAVVLEEREKLRKEAKRKYDREYSRTRDKTYHKFYDSKEWKIASRAYMRDIGYKCEDCGVLATEVHHIEPIQTAEGWDKRLDRDNFRAQCIACHNQKHKRFVKRKTPLDPMKGGG